MAVAQEQEMKARVEEMRAKVVEAESQVPLAMSEALRSGNIGVMDYLNYKNISADTVLLKSINSLSCMFSHILSVQVRQIYCR